MKHNTELDGAVRSLVEAHFSGLRRTVRKNLARLTVGVRDKRGS